MTAGGIYCKARNNDMRTLLLREWTFFRQNMGMRAMYFFDPENGQNDPLRGPNFDIRFGF